MSRTTASGIKSVSQLRALGLALMPAALGIETERKWNTRVQPIIDYVLEVYRDNGYEAADFAPHLEGATLLDTLQNDWSFVKDNITYHVDRPENQYAKTPSRILSDGFGDCKSYSIFLGSLLRYQGIGFVFRVVGYAGKNKDDLQHIYVIVPSAEAPNGYYTLDCCLDAFNQEKQYIIKEDYPMPYVSKLSGVGSDAVISQDVDTLLQLRKELRDNPALYNDLVHPDSLTQIIDQALDALQTGKDQDEQQVYSMIAQIVEQINPGPVPTNPRIGDTFDLSSLSSGGGAGGGLDFLAPGASKLLAPGGFNVQNVLTTGAATGANAVLPGSGQIVSSVLNLITGIFDNHGTIAKANATTATPDAKKVLASFYWSNDADLRGIPSYGQAHGWTQDQINNKSGYYVYHAQPGIDQYNVEDSVSRVSRAKAWFATTPAAYQNAIATGADPVTTNPNFYGTINPLQSQPITPGSSPSTPAPLAFNPTTSSDLPATDSRVVAAANYLDALRTSAPSTFAQIQSQIQNCVPGQVCDGNAVLAWINQQIRANSDFYTSALAYAQNTKPVTSTGSGLLPAQASTAGFSGILPLILIGGVAFFLIKK